MEYSDVREIRNFIANAEQWACACYKVDRDNETLFYSLMCVTNEMTRHLVTARAS